MRKLKLFDEPTVRDDRDFDLLGGDIAREYGRWGLSQNVCSQCFFATVAGVTRWGDSSQRVGVATPSPGAWFCGGQMHVVSKFGVTLKPLTIYHMYLNFNANSSSFRFGVSMLQ